MTNPIRIFLADDHTIVRSGLKGLLAGEADFQLVGEAEDGAETQVLCQKLQPDILLLDLRMAGPPPAQTIAFLREACPLLKIIIFTAYADQQDIADLVPTGIVGYVLKHEANETLVQAIRAARAGRTWFSQTVTARLIELQQANASPLTPREEAVLKLLARGLSNKQIATVLTLSPWTVQDYLSHIYRKLAVRSRGEAAAWAFRRGLLTDEDG